MHEIINVNGVSLIFSPFEDVETASLGIFVKIGSRYETKLQKGIAHFLEHILFKGSKAYSYRQIKREIEGRGGSLNGFTSQELSGYYAIFLSKNLKPTLDILLDMVFNPRFIKEEIEKERNVILEEIKMYNDLPASRAVTLLDKLLWNGHPLGEEVIGNPATVKRLKRSDLVNFKNNYYQPHNMVISCSGNFSKENLVKLLREKIRIGSLKVKFKITPPLPLRGLYIKEEKRQIEQCHLCLGFRSVSYTSKERFIAELMSVILGANMSSRLFEEVREKKALCYDISTEARKYKDSGAFVIHLGLDKSKITTALGSIFKELKKIKKKDVSFKELSRAKDFYLGQIAMGIERPQGRMFYLAESYLTLGKIYTFSDVKREIEGISPSKIRNFAKKIFNFRNSCISCVGNEEGVGTRLKEVVEKAK